MVATGSICYNDTEAEILVGDLVTAWFREDAFSAGGQTRVKILVGMTDDAITLVALNPIEQVTIPRSALHAVHRIFAIKLSEGRLWDLRTVASRDHFVRSQLAGRSIDGERMILP
ncbi:hypothetical protein LRP31_06730 [Mesorhizobium mediterraneum]|uniref:Uncharacterized protein n=1 Tax=Mesorhizobium mediterraneum TaxID=43617 RepID=A0AB36R4J9_9HYPH|nr:hypothetical protein [Mesorhizobium mediterraneum]PAP99496.1 hypothetical protein CIT25_24165 [Mesorhizobium mediterraneum]WIW54925.1 hypothetical protein LRP31_06730 [Mesorhizobium mediterraneum]